MTEKGCWLGKAILDIKVFGITLVDFEFVGGRDLAAYFPLLILG